MKKITTLGACMALGITVSGCFSASEPATAQPWFGKSRALKEDQGIVKNTGRAPQRIKLPYAIQDNWRLTLPVRMAKNSELSISTGRGKEKLRLVNKGGEFVWQHWSVTGDEPHIRSYPNDPFPVKMRYWWERTSYMPNGRYSQNFSLAPIMLDWNAFFLGKFFRDTEIEIKKFADFREDCLAVSRYIKTIEKEKMHIAFIGKTSYEYIACLTGMICSGNVVVPFDPNISVEEACMLFDDADIQMLFCEEEFLGKAEEIQKTYKGIRQVVSLGDWHWFDNIFKVFIMRTSVLFCFIRQICPRSRVIYFYNIINAAINCFVVHVKNCLTF
jgi:hypothetical protein